MTGLSLVPANKNRDGGQWSDDDYDVVVADTRATVGRIFRSQVALGNPCAWFYGLAFPHAKSNADYGYAGSREQAAAKFREIYEARFTPQTEASPVPSDSSP